MNKRRELLDHSSHRELQSACTWIIVNLILWWPLLLAKIKYWKLDCIFLLITDLKQVWDREPAEWRGCMTYARHLVMLVSMNKVGQRLVRWWCSDIRTLNFIVVHLYIELWLARHLMWFCIKARFNIYMAHGTVTVLFASYSPISPVSLNQYKCLH